MTRDREQVGTELLDVDRDLADRLRRIDMDQGTAAPRCRGGFGDRLDGADFILCMNDRDQCGLVVDRGGDMLGIDQAIRLRRHPRDFVPLAFQKRTAYFGRRMFDRAGDDVAARIVDPHHAANGNIARFGAAAGKDDFIGRGADQSRDFGARGFNGIVGAAAKAVRRRRIAELAAQIRQHGVEHRGVDRRGGVVVEINGRRAHRRFTILKM